MFAENLTTEEKGAMLRLMAFIVAADGEVKPQEVAYIDSVASAVSVSATGVFHEIEGVELRTICGEFERDKAKRIVLMEVISSALSDGVMHPTEMEGIKAIASLMEIDSASVDSLVAWARDGIVWRDRGEKLLGLA